MKIISKFLICAVLLAPAVFPGVSFCDGAERMTPSFRGIDDWLDRGDNQQAWQLLLQPELAADSADVLWRKARAQYEMGRIAEKADQEDAPHYFRKAEDYARAAVAEAPQLSDGYKWLAIALGAQSKFSDIKSQVKQSREVKESIEKALSLNPDDDIAYLVLSRWHYKVSALGLFARAYAKLVYGGIPDASLEQSEELLWTAIKLHDRIAHRYNLAKVYDRMGRNSEVIEQLEKTLHLPVTFPEEAEELEKAKEKLTRLK